jgi:hypothetical protein
LDDTVHGPRIGKIFNGIAPTGVGQISPMAIAREVSTLGYLRKAKEDILFLKISFGIPAAATADFWMRQIV